MHRDLDSALLPSRAALAAATLSHHQSSVGTAGSASSVESDSDSDSDSVHSVDDLDGLTGAHRSRNPARPGVIERQEGVSQGFGDSKTASRLLRRLQRTIHGLSASAAESIFEHSEQLNL